MHPIAVVYDTTISLLLPYKKWFEMLMVVLLGPGIDCHNDGLTAVQWSFCIGTGSLSLVVHWVCAKVYSVVL